MIVRIPTAPSGGRAALAFQQAAALHAQGRLREAEQLYRVVLQADDRHFEATCRLGLISLHQSRFDEAHDLFQRAVKLDKKSADAVHSLAVALTGLGRTEDAIRRYEKALQLRPRFAEAHNNLGHALQMARRFRDALTHCESAIRINPSYSEAHNNRGNALRALNRVKDAVDAYQTALTIQPAYADARANLAAALAMLRFDADAQPQGQQIAPLDAQTLVALGSAYFRDNEYELAQSAYRRATAFDKDSEAAVMGLAGTCERVGRYAEAADLFKSMIRRGVRVVDAMEALAGLPGSAVGLDLLPDLDAMAAGERDEQVWLQLAFTRARLLDRAGQHAEAWALFSQANGRLWLSMKAERVQMAEEEKRSLESLRAHPGERHDDSRTERGSPTPLFILGPSRSGKSTMEALASSLAGVKRGYENIGIEKALRATLEGTGLSLESAFEALPAKFHAPFRDIYLTELARRSGSATVFTTTTPGIIHKVDLIATLLPTARFILMRRDRDDVALRIFMKKYLHGNSYAYDLDAIYEHLAWYETMIDLLAEKLPRVVRVVRYEDMVADPCAAMRRLAEFCGMEMNDAAVPPVGDDRRCAEPYRLLMQAARQAK